MDGHTIGFLPQTQKLELHTKQIVPCESILKRFHLNGNTIGVYPQTQKLELHTKQIVPSESILKRFHFHILKG